MDSFDLVAIGTGAAAASAAYKCRRAGRRVAVVDSRPYGGTCALRGCDPKKVLVGAAHAIDQARRLGGKGVEAEASIDWPALMAFKRTFTKPVPQDREASFHEAGIETLHGRARFTSPDRLTVDDREVTAKHFLVATGAMPRPLGIPDEEHVISSTDFLELDELPARVVFVGGGYISFEFAHVAARAGADAVILHRSDRVLKAFDGDLVERLVEATRVLGVDVRLNAPVTAMSRLDDGSLRVETPDGPVSCDLVVHGAGRVPEIHDLDLDAAGVEHDEHGVHVNEYLQSVSNPRVYAAGDAAATQGWPLTPVASLEGHVAAANLLRGNQRRPDYTGTGSVVFTVPPLARVGPTVEEARRDGLQVEVREGTTEDWYSYRRLAQEPAAYKVLVEKGTDRIVAAHLLGDGADEQVNLFALAIRAGLTAGDLKRVPWSYPTHASDLPFMV